MDRKFIVLQDIDSGKEYLVMFDAELAHRDVARGITRETSRSEWAKNMHLEPVSAGFINPSTGFVDPDRGSDSLGLKPRPQDTALVRPDLPLEDLLRILPPPRLPPGPARKTFLERSKGSRTRL